MRRTQAMLIFLALLAAPAGAGPISIGIGAGASEADLGKLRNYVDDLDDKSTARKAFIAYRPLHHVAIEAFYLDIGKYSARVDADSIKADTDGFGLALLAYLPIGQTVDLFLRAGAWRWDIVSTETFDGATEKFRKHGTSPAYGIGLHLVSPTNSAAAVRLECERFRDVGKDFGAFDGADVDVLSFSIVYNF